MLRISRAWSNLLLLIAVCAFASAQGNAPASKENINVVTASFHVGTKQTVPFLAGSLGMIVPNACLSDGTMFIRQAGADGSPSDLKSISRDGKVVVTFAASKITDVSNPYVGSSFADDRTIYFRVHGSEDLKDVKAKARKSNGDIVEFTTKRASRIYEYIARFDRDGSYRGAIKLDIPFRPIQIAAFSGGGFLIAGADATGKPQLALVKWNGQFERYVELVDPADSLDAMDTKDKDPDQVASRYGLDPATYVTSGTRLVPDGGNVLLRRPGDARVFVIAPSGQVRIVRLKVPQGFSVYALYAAGDLWISHLTRRREAGRGMEIVTYSFNPVTGDPVESYVFNEPVGLGLACSTPDTMQFLRQDPKGNIVVWTATQNSHSVAESPQSKPTP